MSLPAQSCRNEQAVVKMADAPDLSLRGRFAPVAISGRQLRFRRRLSNDSTGLCEIAPQGHFLALRAQGATSACGLLAMTSLVALHGRRYCAEICNCQRRSLSAAADAIGWYVLSAPCTNWKCLPEIATGAKRPRNDSSGRVRCTSALLRLNFPVQGAR